jgi:hypothetical protein
VQNNPEALRVPDPVPVLVAFRVCWLRVKAAVTNLLAVIVTVHVFLFTELQPVQPEKLEPVLGVAVRMTTVP